MFPIPFQLTLIVFAVFLASAFVSGVAIALLLNVLLKTPVSKHLLSSGMIAVAGFSVTAAILIFMPGEIGWVNEEPQNFRSALYDHSIIIAAGLAIAYLGIWQLIVRRGSQIEKTKIEEIRG